jgi:hypothetical protein
MKISYRLILLVAICLYADLLTYGQQWQYKLHDKIGDNTAQVFANGATPDGRVKTTLEIKYGCRSPKLFLLEYIITGALEMKNFNFNDFDGSAAPVYMRKKLKLMTVKLRFKSGYENLKIRVIGLPEPDPDNNEKEVFAFTKLEYIGNEFKYGSDVSRLVKALQKNPLSISVSVQSYSDRSKVIRTEFSVAGLSTALTKILRACDKPVKRQ